VTRLRNQEAAHDIYNQIRVLVRATTYLDEPLIRGGYGNNIVAAVSASIAEWQVTFTAANFEVQGINLAGYATGAVASTYQPTLGESQYLTTFSTFIGGITGATVGVAAISMSIGNGVATAVLFQDINQDGAIQVGERTFTEVLTGLQAGMQVIEFEDLGLKFFVDSQNFDPTAQSGYISIDIRREQASFFAGEGMPPTERFRFVLPNLEPENLLGTGNWGPLFTFDVSQRNTAATAVQVIESAIQYVDRVRSQVGALRQGTEVQQNKLADMINMLTNARASVRDADLSRETLELTKWQVIQQSAIAMVAQARLQPQLVLQLFGV
jgi:flagellin